MSTSTVRITESSRATLRQLAKVEGRAMQAILDDAVETYRRQQFIERLNAAYASLRDDQPMAAELKEELDQWETTLGDGLADQ